jgi:hypothetical protein
MKYGMMFLAAVAAFLFSASVGSAAEEAKEAKEFAGKAGCAMCAFKADTKAEKCAAAMKVDDKVVYLLQAGEKADDATKDLLKKMEGAKETIDVKAKGIVKEDGDKKILVVDSLAKVEKVEDKTTDKTEKTKKTRKHKGE